jgi:MinD-like ATPase involved in chromosome partitioning or flagellar assembly
MKQPTKPFALCIDNTDYKVSLIPGKVYPLIPDRKAAKDDLVRIVDESGEDYLYHKSHFVFVDFPPTVRKRLLEIS